ncbi:MAG TPA: DUF177 domain-containing protein [Dehalococcoidia bacterium]
MENFRINVAQLLKEPVGSSRNYHIEEHPVEDEISYIEGELVLIRTNRAIIVNGKLTASIKAICSRCLKPIESKISFEFEEEAYPVSEDLSSAVQYDNLIIDEGNVLDLSEAIRQYALLTLPAKPLCRLDCAGICPTCGHNLNEGLCRCHSNTIDPRWSKLIR